MDLPRHHYCLLAEDVGPGGNSMRRYGFEVTKRGTSIGWTPQTSPAPFLATQHLDRMDAANQSRAFLGDAETGSEK